MVSTPIEQLILERIQGLDDSQKKRVLEFVTSLKPSISARALLDLPPEERQQLISAAFDSAADEDFEIFEAYSEETPND